MSIENNIIRDFKRMDQSIFEPRDATYFDPDYKAPAPSKPWKSKPFGDFDPLGWIHGTLAAAGFVEGYGSVADLADAALYAIEGEWGDAGIAALASIPGGQFARFGQVGSKASKKIIKSLDEQIETQKALKKSKDAGKPTVTVFRGYGDWHKGSMVKDGNFIPHGQFSTRVTREYGMQTPLYTTISSKDASFYAKGYAKKIKGSSPRVLEFELPYKFIKNNAVRPDGEKVTFARDASDYFESTIEATRVFLFKKGIPTKYLKKVYKDF